MTYAIAVLFVAQVLVPVVLIVSLWRSSLSGKPPTKVSWLAGVLGSGAYVSYFLLAGRWDWVGYYLRAALLVAFLLALYASFRRTFGGDEEVPWWRPPGSLNGWLSLVANAALALFFGALIVLAAQGFSHGDQRAAELSFPLEGGVYYVGQGGNSPLLNHHNVVSAQRFALDVTRLNPAGTRAAGLYPSDPSRYAVFGEGIRSPCGGEVIEATDGQPDHRPYGTDRENPAGNHVVVRCAEEGGDLNLEVVLAHMKQGSVAVERGERVGEGRLLGRVGNSGNTSEPHLHVHAVRAGSGSALEGEGLPIRFEGRFLVRNGLLFR
jgi:hypothetical protein